MTGMAYGLVTFDDNSWCKTYFSSLGGIAIVEYDFKPGLLKVKAIHSKFYKSYQFRIYRTVSISADQHIGELWFFSNEGDLKSVSVNHVTGNTLLKEAYFNPEKQFRGGQRFAYRGDEMLYAFEYNAKGELFNCLDMDDGQSTRIDDIYDLENKEAFRYFGDITPPSELMQ